MKRIPYPVLFITVILILIRGGCAVNEWIKTREFPITFVPRTLLVKAVYSGVMPDGTEIQHNSVCVEDLHSGVSSSFLMKKYFFLDGYQVKEGDVLAIQWGELSRIVQAVPPVVKN